MILAAVGKNGTGKDFFLDYVAQKYELPDDLHRRCCPRARN